MGCQGNARVEVVSEALASIVRREMPVGQVLGMLKRLMTRFLDAVEAEGDEVSFAIKPFAAGWKTNSRKTRNEVLGRGILPITYYEKLSLVIC